MIYIMAVTVRNVDDAGFWYAGSGFLACRSPAGCQLLLEF